MENPNLDNAPLAPQMPQNAPQMQPPMPPMAGEFGADTLSQVSQMLGLNKLASIEQLNDLQAKLTQMNEAAQTEKNIASAINQTPEVDASVVKTELEKLEKTDPEFAKQIKLSQTGMNMFVQNLKSQIAPKGNADPISDEGASANGDEDENAQLIKKIKSGKADDIDYGKFYLLSQNTK